MKYFKRLLLTVPVLALVCYASGLLSALAQEVPRELPINGAFVDADGDSVPDGWVGIELAPTDGVFCKTVCSFKFTGSTARRTLLAMVDAYTPPGYRFTFTVDVVLSNVGHDSYFQVMAMNGKHLNTTYLMTIPEGVKQKRKLTISGIVRGDGADRFYVIVNVTAGKLKLTNAHLTTDATALPLPDTTASDVSISDPQPACRQPVFSEWRLNKQRVGYDDYHGWFFKCYYNAPGDVFPYDTKRLCPATISKPVAGDVPYTEHWTRQKFAIHDDPQRVRCVYVGYTVTYPSQ